MQWVNLGAIKIFIVILHSQQNISSLKYSARGYREKIKKTVHFYKTIPILVSGKLYEHKSLYHRTEHCNVMYVGQTKYHRKLSCELKPMVEWGFEKDN